MATKNDKPPTEEKQLPMVVAAPRFHMMTQGEARSMAQLFITAGLFEPSAKEAEKGMTAEKKEALAAVRILYGTSLGLNPFAAMKGVHIVQGKPELGYQMILALIAAHPRYSYEVIQANNERVELAWFRDGKLLGKTKFDTDDMQRAKLGGDIWMKYPRQMRTARAVREGADRFCAEVFSGMSSSADEVGYEVACVADIEGGMGVTIEATGGEVEYGTPDENGEVKPVTPKQQSKSQADGKTAQGGGQTGKPQSGGQQSQETATSASQGAASAPKAGNTSTTDTQLVDLSPLGKELMSDINEALLEPESHPFVLDAMRTRIKAAFAEMFGSELVGHKLVNWYLMNKAGVTKDNVAQVMTWQVLKDALNWARNPSNTSNLIAEAQKG